MGTPEPVFPSESDPETDDDNNPSQSKESTTKTNGTRLAPHIQSPRLPQAATAAAVAAFQVLRFGPNLSELQRKPT